MKLLDDYVAEIFGIDVNDLYTDSRSRPVVEARQVCMKLTREYCGKTFEEIGKYYNKSHCAVVYAMKTVQNLLANKRFAEKYKTIHAECEAKMVEIPFLRVPEVTNCLMEEDYLTKIQ